MKTKVTKVHGSRFTVKTPKAHTLRRQPTVNREPLNREPLYTEVTP